MWDAVISEAQKMDADDFVRAEYLKAEGQTKIVVRMDCAYFGAKLYVGENVFIDAFNDKEPYDVLTHIFYVPSALLSEGEELLLTGDDSMTDGDSYYTTWVFTPEYADENALLSDYDSGWNVQSTDEEMIADGLLYRHYHILDKNEMPVEAFLLDIDSAKNTLYIGTPMDGYIAQNVRATVPDMIKAATQNGHHVLAATNADFFDMFGDSSPSGLCVKNGKCIANADSKRPFIGILRDGTAVITTQTECPDIQGDLLQAAAGIEMIVKDGKIYEWGPLEPFAFVRHPRTAAGVTKDGHILLLEVDGRIPTYSNGASLVDLAKMLISLGADRAINMDGGGSSVVYTKNGDEYLLRTNPADLHRPTEKLIREEYNGLLVVPKSELNFKLG